MATIGNRGATWTNSDGLVVGFGTNHPAFTGGVREGSGVTSAATGFSWSDLNDAKAVAVSVPAGARVLDVRLLVTEAFTSTGTNTITVGDGSDTDGFITVAVTETSMLTAGASIGPNGVYAFGATDTGAAELKTYSAADTIDLASAQTDWTAGKAQLIVSYMA